MIVTEEGIGRCFYYPYRFEKQALKRFNSVSWKFCTRIMFEWENGAFVKELRQGGLTLMPLKTIRRAVMRFNVCRKVFTQFDTLGLCSYHFLDDKNAYISYASSQCASWCLDDGNSLPREKYFRNISYSRSQRRFQGLVDWSPTSFCGDQLWEYEMVFDEAFSSIVDGQVRHYTPEVSDRDSNEQVLYYRAPQSDPAPPSDAAAKEVRYSIENVLRYSRWRRKDDSAADSDNAPRSFPGALPGVLQDAESGALHGTLQDAQPCLPHEGDKMREPESCPRRRSLSCPTDTDACKTHPMSFLSSADWI